LECWLDVHRSDVRLSGAYDCVFDVFSLVFAGPWPDATHPVVSYVHAFSAVARWPAPQNSKVSKFARRYTTIPAYHASALNLFYRGADGLSLFNYDYVPANLRLAMAPGLKRITEVEFLKTKSKHYVVSPGFGSLPRANKASIDLVVADDTAKVTFDHSVLRVETRESCVGLQIAVSLNGQRLKLCEHHENALFLPLAQNAGYAARETLQFYSVPLDLLIPGNNKVEIENLDRARTSCNFVSMELGLFRPKQD
jgi:hypothetical protein